MNTLARYSFIHETPVGPLLIESDGISITGCSFYRNNTNLRHELPRDIYDCGVLTQCAHELDAYFNGDLRQFSVKLRPAGTAFQLAVWDVLLKIPYGETISYKQLAEAVGNPKAVRAVGGANHCNKIVIIIPCHRVIGADGSLTGFGGGLETKRFLLEHEKKMLTN